MRVIHKHAERLAERDVLEPARHWPHRIQRGLDRMHADLEDEARADGGQGVVHIVAANQRQTARKFLLRRLNDHFRGIFAELDLRGAKLRRLAKSVGELRLNACFLRQPRAERIVQIDDGASPFRATRQRDK